MGRTPPGLALSEVRLLLRSPEQFSDGVNLAQEAVGDDDVVRLLRLARALGRHPEEVVQVRELLEVLDFEVVGPEDPEVVLHQVGALLFDDGGANLEVGVARGVVLLHAGPHGLCFDPSLGRVVDATREVAVRRDDERCGGGVEVCVDAVQKRHGFAFRSCCTGVQTLFPYAG